MYSIPYEAINVRWRITSVLVPILKESSRNKLPNWAKYLTNDKSDINLEKFFNEYTKILKSLMILNKKSALFIFRLIQDYWLRFLYPNIYNKYSVFNSAAFSYLDFPLDLCNVGYKPFCPFLVHV